MSLQSEVKLRDMEAELGRLKEKVLLLTSQVDDLSARLNPAQVLGKRKPGRPSKALKVGTGSAISVGHGGLTSKGYVIE